jgi:hypothetical protein
LGRFDGFVLSCLGDFISMGGCHCHLQVIESTLWTLAWENRLRLATMQVLKMSSWGKCQQWGFRMDGKSIHSFMPTTLYSVKGVPLRVVFMICLRLTSNEGYCKTKSFFLCCENIIRVIIYHISSWSMKNDIKN